MAGARTCSAVHSTVIKEGAATARNGGGVTQIRDFLTVRTSRTLMPRLCLRAWPCLREGVEARAREGRAPRGVMVLALLRQSRMQHCGRALALPLACKAPNEIQACFVTALAYNAQSSRLNRFDSWSASWCGDVIDVQGMGHALHAVRAHKVVKPFAV